MARIAVSVFQRKSNPTAFAVTPNRDGQILPDAQDWEFVTPATVDPVQARAMGSSEINGWVASFQKDGYCLLSNDPRGGVYLTEIENVSPADIEALGNRK